MVLPSGDQYEISAAGYTAVVTEGGAALRVLRHHGRDLVHGFDESAMSTGGRGQLLMPWPNRIRDGRYSFGGHDLQLGLTDPRTGNASHGLARWAPWTVEEHTATSVSLVHRLMAQTGYPWALDLHVLYDLSADGLVVTQTATNLAAEPAPYASGAHPYLCVGDAIEDLELTLPARTRVVLDDRQLPTGVEPVGDDLDFTTGRRIGDRVLDQGFGDLRHVEGRARVTLTEPSGERGRRAVGGRAPPVAAGLHAARGRAAPGAGGRADDRAGRRLQLRHRPRHAGPGRHRGRRALGLVGHPRPAAADARTRSVGRTA